MSPKQFQRAARAKVNSALVSAQMNYRSPSHESSKIPANVPHPHGTFKPGAEGLVMSPAANLPVPKKAAKSTAKKRTAVKRRKPASRTKERK